MLDKTAVRTYMRARRDATPPGDRLAAAARVAALLRDEPFMRQANHVLCYCAHGSELGTLGLIADLIAAGKTVSVPMIFGHGVMHAHCVTCVDDLVPGKFGILCPAKPAPADTVPQVSLCPGVAYTPRGDRVGSGAGYYDRYLAAHPGVLTVGLGYDFQVVDELPVEPNDQPMRYVVTDQRVIDCRAG